MTVAGVLISGFSVGIFNLALFGMDPFQVFAHGIWRHTPIGYVAQFSSWMFNVLIPGSSLIIRSIALFMGPIIVFFNKKVAIPFRYGKNIPAYLEH